MALPGEFQSAYAGKPAPPVPADGVPEGEAPVSADAPALTSSPTTQILVVGNSQFVSNTFLRMAPENILFFQNAVDWMTLEPRRPPGLLHLPRAGARLVS